MPNAAILAQESVAELSADILKEDVANRDWKLFEVNCSALAKSMRRAICVMLVSGMDMEEIL